MATEYDGYSVNLTERDWGARYTNVKIANATISGGQWVNNDFDYSHDRPTGLLFTNATSASLFNSAILGFDAGCVEISDRQVYRDGTDELYETQVTVGNTHGYCADGFYRPDRNRDSANTEYGIREGQFDLTATMAADVGYLVIHWLRIPSMLEVVVLSLR